MNGAELTEIIKNLSSLANADGGGAACGGESSSSTSAAATTAAAASAIERTRSDLAAAAPNSSGHGRAVALVFNHPKIPPLPVRQRRELFEAQPEQDRADVSNAMTEAPKDDDDEFVGEGRIADHQAKGFAVAIASERPLFQQISGSYMPHGCVKM